MATDIASEWFVCSALHNGKRLKPEDKKLNQAEDKRLNHPKDEKLNQPEKKNINEYEDDTVSIGQTRKVMLTVPILGLAVQDTRRVRTRVGII